MSLEEELEEAKELGDTREAVGAAADIASRALAANDLGLAVDAKQHEVQVARTIGMHNHVVVVTAEAVEMWPRIKAMAEIDEQHRASMRSIEDDLGELHYGTDPAAALVSEASSTTVAMKR